MSHTLTSSSVPKGAPRGVISLPPAKGAMPAACGVSLRADKLARRPRCVSLPAINTVWWENGDSYGNPLLAQRGGRATPAGGLPASDYALSVRRTIMPAQCGAMGVGVGKPNRRCNSTYMPVMVTRPCAADVCQPPSASRKEKDMSWREEAKRLGIPIVVAHRLLANAPLTTNDWQAVYIAYQGFLAQVRLIVAQSRNKTEFAPGYVPKC